MANAEEELTSITDHQDTIKFSRTKRTPPHSVNLCKLQMVSHMPHRLKTTLTPTRQAVAVSLRKTFLLPLDGLLSMVREFLNPLVWRWGHDCNLRRHAVSNLRDLKPAAPQSAHKSLKVCLYA